MNTSRLQSFSDSVMGVVITLTVFALTKPVGTQFADLLPMLPVFIVYVISFTFIGIYWNNHHHLFLAAKYVTARLMWRNLMFLFWLSLIPFMTGWLGENYAAPVPTAFYGALLLFCALAFTLLTRSVLAQHTDLKALEDEKGNSRKGLISLVAYAAAIPFAFVSHWISDALFILVSVLWFVPDRGYVALWRTMG